MQESIAPATLKAVTKILNDHNMTAPGAKPKCPLCTWESYTQDGWSWRMSSSQTALGRLKRHMRDKHRAYYNLAVTKPFVIEEEEEDSWLSQVQ